MGEEEGEEPGDGEPHMKTKGDRNFRLSGNVRDMDSKSECSYRSPKFKRCQLY